MLIQRSVYMECQSDSRKGKHEWWSRLLSGIYGCYDSTDQTVKAFLRPIFRIPPETHPLNGNGFTAPSDAPIEEQQNARFPPKFMLAGRAKKANLPYIVLCCLILQICLCILTVGFHLLVKYQICQCHIE